jgi:hypothetical protein
MHIARCTLINCYHMRSVRRLFVTACAVYADNDKEKSGNFLQGPKTSNSYYELSKKGWLVLLQCPFQMIDEHYLRESPSVSTSSAKISTASSQSRMFVSIQHRFLSQKGTVPRDFSLNCYYTQTLMPAICIFRNSLTNRFGC